MGSTTADANEAVIRAYFDAWDDGDVAAITACFADDFATTYAGPSGETVRVGPGDVPDWIAGWLDVIGDMRHDVHDLVAEGDRVLARITYTGRHRGEVFGVEPTGNRLEVREFLSFRIEDGKIAEMDWLSDDLALLRQLGVELPDGS